MRLRRRCSANSGLWQAMEVIEMLSQALPIGLPFLPKRQRTVPPLVAQETPSCCASVEWDHSRAVPM